MSARRQTGQAPLFGDGPAVVSASSPPTCRLCEKPLHRGGVDGAHKVCADRAARIESPLTPEVVQIRDHYAAVFERLTGQLPTFGAREGASVARLAKAVGVKRACQMIDYALTNVRTSQYATINSIAAEPDRFVERRPAPRGSMQPRATHRTAEPETGATNNEPDPWGLQGRADARR